MLWRRKKEPDPPQMPTTQSVEISDRAKEILTEAAQARELFTKLFTENHFSRKMRKSLKNPKKK